MKKFRRCLREEALMALRELAAAPEENWWKEILRLWSPSGTEGGLRLAIRKNTIDVYREGSVVAHIGFGSGKRGQSAPMHVETHVKYLRGEHAGNGSVKLQLVGRLWKWSDNLPYVSFEQISVTIDDRMRALREGKYARKGL